MSDDDPKNKSEPLTAVEKANRFLKWLKEYCEARVDILDYNHLVEIMQISAAANERLHTGLSDVDGFLTFDDVEQILLEESRQMHEANLKSMLAGLKNKPGGGGLGEKETSSKKRGGSKKKG